jgi:hypothetical protein
MIDDHGGHPQEELTLVQASALGGACYRQSERIWKGCRVLETSLVCRQAKH